jgi:hypothetical protein
VQNALIFNPEKTPNSKCDAITTTGRKQEPKQIQNKA